MKQKALIKQLEDFIDNLMDEWTLREVEIEITPKYGNTLKISKKFREEE